MNNNNYKPWGNKAPTQYVEDYFSDSTLDDEVDDMYKGQEEVLKDTPVTL